MAYQNYFTPTGFALFMGKTLNDLFNGATRIQSLLVTALTTTSLTTSGTLTINGAISAGAQTLTATGTTQLGAAAISAAVSFALITVATTASTHGVRLPVPAAVGQVMQVGNNGAFGVKVYPATGGQIGAASTNAADTTVLAVNKINEYVAATATKWIVDRGA